MLITLCISPGSERLFGVSMRTPNVCPPLPSTLDRDGTQTWLVVSVEAEGRFFRPSRGPLVAVHIGRESHHRLDLPPGRRGFSFCEVTFASWEGRLRLLYHRSIVRWYKKLLVRREYVGGGRTWQARRRLQLPSACVARLCRRRRRGRRSRQVRVGGCLTWRLGYSSSAVIAPCRCAISRLPPS